MVLTYPNSVLNSFVFTPIFVTNNFTLFSFDGSPPIRNQHYVSGINLFIQIFCIIIILYKNYMKTGPFYKILLILSSIITLRIVICSLSLAYMPFHAETETVRKFSLYVDYCSSLFSLTITFLLSLNRCLAFTARTLNRLFFEDNGIFPSVLLSAVIAIMGACGIILTSEVKRVYVDLLGFVDAGPDKGLRVLINRAFNIFPIGSIISYVVLYHFFYKESRNKSTKLVFTRRGEQQVFVQLLLTASLYVVLSSMYEIVVIVDWKNNYKMSTWLSWLDFLAVANYLPEMVLPLSVTIGSLNIMKRIKNATRPRDDRPVPTITN